MSPAEAAREGALATILAAAVVVTIVAAAAHDHADQLVMWAANHLGHRSNP